MIKQYNGEKKVDCYIMIHDAFHDYNLCFVQKEDISSSLIACSEFRW